jgi:hypothetical protein
MNEERMNGFSGIFRIVIKMHCLSPLTIHTYHSKQRHVRYSSATTPTFYQTVIGMRNTADMTGVKPIAVLPQSISGMTANSLVAFHDIHGRKGVVLFFCSFPDTTRDCFNYVGIKEDDR